jgi:lipoate-protein ligase A
VVGERKISGNAQFSSVKRMVSHGTLLFDTDMDEVMKALDVKMSKIESKGHKSVRSRVANISEFLDGPVSVKEFRSLLLKGLYKDRTNFETYHLNDEEWQQVHRLKDEKYATWDWNFGSSPKFNIQRSRRFAIGEIDLRIGVEKGLIENIKIYGDFFGKEPVEQLEERLQGIRYERGDIKEAIGPIELEEYFGDVPKADFVELVYGNDE